MHFFSLLSFSETLNGGIQLVQNNVTRKEEFVSSTEPVKQIIDLKKTDADYIKSAPTVITYWFVDCVYYGLTNDMIFNFNYTDPDHTHMVEALVVADFTPLPPTTTIPPSTTTTKTTTTKPTTTTPTTPTTKITTTTKTTTTTTKTTTTTAKTTTKPTVVTVKSTVQPNITTANSIVGSTGKSLVKREALPPPKQVPVFNNSTSKVMVKVNGTLVPYNVSFPYVCNNTHVTIDPKKSYGYFAKEVVVKGKCFILHFIG